MRANDIKEIADRHVKGEGDGCLSQVHEHATQAYADRWYLLSFVLKIADIDPMVIVYEYGEPDSECRFCGQPEHNEHKPECLWLIAQSVRLP